MIPVVGPLLQGALALAAALVILTSWIAMGTVIRPVREESPLLDLCYAVIFGSAISSFALLFAAFAGFAVGGTIVISILLVAIVFLRRKAIVSAASRTTSLLPANRGDRWLIIAVLIVLVVYAMAPPRDGDIVRYHLAHIRQIAAENRWSWIPDVMYALPFAFTINYLPFEIARIPEAAGFVNSILWVVVFFAVMEATAREGNDRYRYLVCLCFLAHPYLIKVFSAAFPDAYAILLTTVLGIGLSRIRVSAKHDLASLGFVCWIGVASRYQLVAIALCGTIIALAYLAYNRSWNGMKFFVAGSAIALLAASPFYLMNWIHTGNPVWPLSLPFVPSDGSFLQQLGKDFARPFSWPPLLPLSLSVKRLFTEQFIAPLPIVLSLVAVTGACIRRNEFRAASLLSCGFLALWVAMSPRLYPTHLIPIVALGPLVLASSIKNPGRFGIIALRAISLVFLLLSLFFSWDYLRYDITGDEREFHRYTWYYNVYDWVNHNTPPQSRVLVVVSSGVTYYLDRPYRKADPWLTGEVNWSRINSPPALDSVMKRGGFDYLIYHDANYWKAHAGGEQMIDVIHAAASQGSLVQVHHSVVKLYRSRVKRTFDSANVYVYKRAAPYSFSGQP